MTGVVRSAFEDTGEDLEEWSDPVEWVNNMLTLELVTDGLKARIGLYAGEVKQFGAIARYDSMMKLECAKVTKPELTESKKMELFRTTWTPETKKITQWDTEGRPFRTIEALFKSSYN